MINTISPDVAVRVLSFVDGSDIINVMLTCRHFSDMLKDDYIWHLLLQHRVSPQMMASLNSHDYPTHKKKYIELTRRRHYAVNSNLVAIAWGNDQRYWTVREDSKAGCGRIMHLLSVCWFDIQTTFNVPNGVWYVVWTIRRKSKWDVSFVATNPVGAEEGEGKQVIKAHFQRSAKSSDSRIASFQQYCMPQPIVVNSRSGFGDIKVSASRLTGEWKYDFDLDYIEVISEKEKRASESPEHTAQKVKATRGGLFGAIRRLTQGKLTTMSKSDFKMIALIPGEGEIDNDDDDDDGLVEM